MYIYGLTYIYTKIHMPVDSTVVTAPALIHKTISLPKRKPGRPRTNDMNIEELAKHAVIRELRRGNGRVGLAVLEALGVLKPLPEQSNILESAISSLLPVGVDIVSNVQPAPPVDNVSHVQPIQAAKKPISDGDISDCGQNFSASGLLSADSAALSAPNNRVEPELEDEP